MRESLDIITITFIIISLYHYTDYRPKGGFTPEISKFNTMQSDFMSYLK